MDYLQQSKIFHVTNNIFLENGRQIFTKFIKKKNAISWENIEVYFHET